MASRHAASPKDIGRVLDKVRPLARMLDIETEHMLHGMLDAFEGIMDSPHARQPLPPGARGVAEGYTAAYAEGWNTGVALTRGATRHL